ncbi:MAG: ribonuclease P protein component [Myxococcales bacterium]|nr:ribonuclease P protein component [Myxococcales bacterium]
MDDARDRPRGERFPRSHRILTRRDFLRVQQTGKRVHTPHFVIIVLPAPRKRLGITVTKRVAGAVGRNRIRRCLREVYRRNGELFPEGCDVVVIARSGAGELGYRSMLEEMQGARDAMARAAGARAAGGAS